ncbi:MAG: glycosyltransferase family 2 protein [Lachnospiraceae bacterium]|nr:glycosyltransferase family 2 protein [Lachnospiraceae bacterium]
MILASSNSNEVFNDVVVLILNYRSSALTIGCAENVMNLGSNISIVIVDNNSNDQSFDVISKRFEKDENVHVIASNENKGYASGNNFGFRYIKNNISAAKYVLLLNPDIIVPSYETIYRMRQALVCDNELGLVSCQIIYNDLWRGFSDFGWQLPSFKHLVWAGTFLSRLFLRNINNAYSAVQITDKIAKVDVVSGCCFMSNLDILCDVDYLDERTFLYFEETILAKKLKAIGKTEGIILDQFVYHNHQEKDKSLKNYKKKLFDRKTFHASKKVYTKYYSGLNGFQKFLCSVVNGVDMFFKNVVYGLAALIFH